MTHGFTETDVTPWPSLAALNEAFDLLLNRRPDLYESLLSQWKALPPAGNQRLALYFRVKDALESPQKSPSKEFEFQRAGHTPQQIWAKIADNLFTHDHVKIECDSPNHALCMRDRLYQYRRKQRRMGVTSLDQYQLQVRDRTIVAKPAFEPVVLRIICGPPRAKAPRAEASSSSDGREDPGPPSSATNDRGGTRQDA